MYQISSPNIVKILKMCKQPTRYTDFIRELDISDTAIENNLKRLIKKGWIQKTEDKKYILTEEGRRILEEIDVVGSIRILGIEDDYVKIIRKKAALKALYKQLLYAYLICFRKKMHKKRVEAEQHLCILEQILKDAGFKDVMEQVKREVDINLEDIYSDALKGWEFLKDDEFLKTACEEIAVLQQWIDPKLFNSETLSDLIKINEFVKKVVEEVCKQS